MTNNSDNNNDDLALLEFYQAIGVDLAFDEKPKYRFIDNNFKPKSAKTTPAKPIIRQNNNLNEEQIAASAKTLEELRQKLNDFDGCALKFSATQLVFSDGNPRADIMIIGEAPGRDEDIEGKPFVGRSGQLLDKMLKAISLDRDKVYIANIVPWRPPGNRNPTKDEIASCLPFLHRQIELVNPKIIMTLGAPAAHTLFYCTTPISKLRGIWRRFELNNLSIPALPTLHPAYLLRQPLQKKLAWQDMLALKKRIKELNNNG